MTESVRPEAHALLEMAQSLGLTDKQRVFSEAYVADPERNGTAACRVAGYQGDDATLAVQASRALNIAKVKSYISALLATAHALAEKRTGRKILSAVDVLERLSEHADADLGDFITDGQDGKPPTIDVDRSKTRLLKEIAIEEGCDKDGMPWTKTKIKLVDQQGALDKLARYHGLYKTESAPASQTNTQINIYKDLDKLSTGDLRKIRETRQLAEGGKD